MIALNGYMDVADECWRPSCGGDEFEMLLMTSHVANIKSQAPTSNIGHQHQILAYYDIGDRLECHQHTWFVASI